jgi:heat shock protein HslJ
LPVYKLENSMNRLLFAALMMLMLAGCKQESAQTNEPGPASAETPSVDSSPAPEESVAEVAEPAAQPSGEELLEAYHWRLQNATNANNTRIDALFARPDLPVQLDFVQGRLAISNTCNRMSGGYTIDETRLQISPLASTLMACSDDALNLLDQAISARFAGAMSFESQVSGESARLVMTTEAGDRFVFTGHPTAETRFGGPGVRIFLEVAAQTQPCTHPLIPEFQCLQVREIAFDEQGLRTGTPGEFQHFYDTIEGYTHEPGVRNVLRVLRFDRDPAPADASAYAYILDMVVESEQL